MKGYSDINDLNNIDGFIRDSLKDFKAEPSENLWDKLDNNLNIQTSHTGNPNPVNNPANSITSKIISIAGKSWFYYAAAASVVTVGVIAAITYFTLNSDEKTLEKQEAINNPNEKVIENNNLKENEKNNDKNFTPIIDNSNKPEKENVVNPNSILIDNQVNYSDNDQNQNKKEENIIIKDNDNKQKELNNQSIVVDQNKNNITPQKEEQKNIETPVAENKDKKKKDIKVKEEPEQEVVEENVDDQLTMNSGDQTEFGDEFRLEIPNAFTPNGDGINDRFVIGKLNSVDNPSLLVYDSRGRVVYKSSKYQNDWDGANAPDGTYYFFLQYVYKNKTEVKGGSIYISR